MEDFCAKIISEIKQARDERELIRVIGDSLFLLRTERKSFNEAGYFMNMIASLKEVDGDNSSEMADNISLAISIFRQFQKNNPERIC
jgi:hypothetical protein